MEETDGTAFDSLAGNSGNLFRLFLSGVQDRSHLEVVFGAVYVGLNSPI